MNRPSKIPRKKTIADAIYASARWKRLSKLCLHQEPLCRICRESGRTTIAEHSHHIEKLAMRPDLAFARENICSVCIECHRTLD